jgi:hypothetical protein
VLLKNDGILPLDPAANTRIAVIGEFARTPRYQGAGSSQVVPTRLDNALDEIRTIAVGPEITFAPGYSLDESGSATGLLVDEAVSLAASADVAVVFLGLPAEDESEGFDREHIELPAAQTELLDAVLAANPRVVVVLSNGSVVRLSGRAGEPPRSWRAGSSVRPVGEPSPTCSSGWSTRRAGWPRRFPFDSRTPRRTSTSRARRATCGTGKACSSATGITTVETWR